MDTQPDSSSPQPSGQESPDSGWRLISSTTISLGALAMISIGWFMGKIPDYRVALVAMVLVAYPTNSFSILSTVVKSKLSK